MSSMLYELCGGDGEHAICDICVVVVACYL